MGWVDLHTHTTASDGSLQPEELVQLAAERGVQVLGVTDHDGVDGLARAQQAAQQYGVILVPGIELGTVVAAGEVHILGYFFDPANEQLERHLSRLVEARRERALRIIEQLQQLGFPVSYADLKEIAQGGVITRAHAARLLVQRGYVETIDEAFERYLGRNRPGYVPLGYPTPREAIRIILAAGGIPVLAHPFSVHDLDSTLKELVAAGLLGLEAWYAEYPSTSQHALVELAREYGLLVTGGSDYHGPGFREGRELGSVTVPREAVIALFDQAGRQIPELLATLPDQ